MRNWILTTGVASIALMLSGTLMAAGEVIMTEGAMNEDPATTFESIDTDGDHYISKEEAAARGDLKANWDRIDTDHNNQLNISEFSAFEGEGRLTPPEESEIPEPGAAPYDPGK